MKDYMRVRVIEIAKYILETKATVRKAAKVLVSVKALFTRT